MAESQLPIFNPATIGFIASSHGVDATEELSPILGLPAGRLKAWEAGVDAPSWSELGQLCRATGLAPESMVLRRAPMQAAA